MSRRYPALELLARRLHRAGCRHCRCRRSRRGLLPDGGHRPASAPRIADGRDADELPSLGRADGKLGARRRSVVPMVSAFIRSLLLLGDDQVIGTTRRQSAGRASSACPRAGQAGRAGGGRPSQQRWSLSLDDVCQDVLSCGRQACEPCGPSSTKPAHQPGAACILEEEAGQR